MMNKTDLARLEVIEREIRRIAEAEGLATTEVDFQIVPASRVIEGMAYNFPINFSHWSHGRDYDRIRTIYENTMHGIPYEQVWNFDTPKALMAETNPFALHAFVVAHVYGHVDFFLRNKFTQRGRTFSDVAEEARNAADRFLKYEQRFGADQVEGVIDAGLSIRWHQHPDVFFEEADEDEIRGRMIELERARLSYGRNPVSMIEKALTPPEIKMIEDRIRRLGHKTPPEPTYDLLGYIIRNSKRPLAAWMKDVLSVIRNQARSLMPNGRTKMLNEGWASYWHVRIMRKLFEAGLLTPEEHGVFNKYHAGVTRENKATINPYRLGLALYEHVEDQWNMGRFGSEYEKCQDPYERAHWDTKAGEGRKKIFEVSSSYSDRMAVENLFSDEFIREQRIYIYKPFKEDDQIVYRIVEKRPAKIREILKREMSFSNVPQITVEDGNLNGSNQLLLKHHWTGFDLDILYCEKTLDKIFRLWGRPIFLETFQESEPVLWRYNGQKLEKGVIKDLAS